METIWCQCHIEVICLGYLGVMKALGSHYKVILVKTLLRVMSIDRSRQLCHTKQKGSAVIFSFVLCFNFKLRYIRKVSLSIESFRRLLAIAGSMESGITSSSFKKMKKTSMKLFYCMFRLVIHEYYRKLSAYLII